MKNPHYLLQCGLIFGIQPHVILGDSVPHLVRCLSILSKDCLEGGLGKADIGPSQSRSRTSHLARAEPLPFLPPTVETAQLNLNIHPIAWEEGNISRPLQRPRSLPGATKIGGEGNSTSNATAWATPNPLDQLCRLWPNQPVTILAMGYSARESCVILRDAPKALRDDDSREAARQGQVPSLHADKPSHGTLACCTTTVLFNFLVTQIGLEGSYPATEFLILQDRLLGSWSSLRWPASNLFQSWRWSCFL